MPYDASKFSLKNIVKTASGRLQIFAPKGADGAGIVSEGRQERQA